MAAKNKLLLGLGLAALALLLILIVVGVFIWKPWENGGDKNGNANKPHGLVPGADCTLQPPSWQGFNLMPGGYTVPCLEALVKRLGHLSLRNNLSSYINPASADYWESDLRGFLDANSTNVSLYTCLEWADESDLAALSQGRMPYLTHVQINGGIWQGTPLSDNPTEDDLVKLQGFNLAAYASWLTKVNNALDPRVTMVIPFKQYSTQMPGGGSDMGQILTHCAALQSSGTKRRPFGVETTIYPFWGAQTGAAPDAGALKAALDAFSGVADACKTHFSFPGRLDPLIAESGWPVSCVGAKAGGHGPTVASLANAKAYWALMTKYVPRNPNFRLYYWQMSDVDNGDGCGHTWGVVDRANCCFI
jgi:hypothetical protein